LPILWELFPGHPNLLPAFFSETECAEKSAGRYVSKPKLSREGANVRVHAAGKVVYQTEGEYGEEGFIHQAFIDSADHEGNRPVLGVWMVQGEACGLGIREDKALVTGNCSRFVPHLFI
jgi:glutathionylspermidine synthase